MCEEQDLLYMSEEPISDSFIIFVLCLHFGRFIIFCMIFDFGINYLCRKSDNCLAFMLQNINIKDVTKGMA